ncbi:retron system putative HNH endonuclease [Luteibacter aegosomatis]|uniref:retron system putative HNH endonuclease n=1 Tax=Luteibacter aegosomatis TaxID=2911537 RepID=UPI003CE59A4A
MTAHHCAFCDVVTGVSSRETVEHFKPKRRFPREAYSWANLYPCCDVCQASKRENYDEMLLAPDMEAFRFEDYFVFNFLTGEIEPSPAASESERARAATTIRLYALNSAARNKARLQELRQMGLDRESLMEDWNFRFLYQSSRIE